MQQQELKNIIQNSKWQPEEKTQLLLLLPNFGNKMWEFIADEVASFGSQFESKYLLSALADFVAYSNDLAAGNPEKFIALLSVSPEDARYDFGRYVLPYVLDIKLLVRQNKLRASSEVSDAITEFEARFFENLPNDEWVQILQENLLEFLSKNYDIAALLQGFYTSHFNGKKKEFIISLLQALEKNREVLGQQPLVLEGKKLSPQVQYWIKDYIGFIPRIGSDRSTFDEVKYLKGSPNVSKLSITEKNSLLQILKIYSWLLNPRELSQEEVSEGDRELFAKSASVKSAPQTVNISQVPLKTGAIIPDSSFLPKRISPLHDIKIPKVDIDKKLEALKNKVK